jgi:hypothetical protein
LNSKQKRLQDIEIEILNLHTHTVPDCMTIRYVKM